MEEGFTKVEMPGAHKCHFVDLETLKGFSL